MKKILALILALVMCLSLVACGAKDEPAKEEGGEDAPLRLLYACTDKAAQYFNDSYNGFKTVWDANGVVHMLDAPAGGYSVEKQIAHLETAIASGEWDVIMVYADKPDAMGHLVEYADEYGVKLIGFCQDATSNMGHMYYGTSTTQQGTMNAQMAIDYVNANPDLYAEFDENNKIPFAVMANYDAPNLLARDTVGRELLEADGRFECVYDQQVDNAEDAIRWAEDLITTHPEVKIIIGGYDGVALPIAAAFEAAGYGDDKSIAIYGHDCLPETQAMIRAGGLVRGSGYGVYEEMGQALLDLAKDLMAGKTEADYGDDAPYIHCWGITAENIDEFFPQ